MKSVPEAMFLEVIAVSILVANHSEDTELGLSGLVLISSNLLVQLLIPIPTINTNAIYILSEFFIITIKLKFTYALFIFPT